LSSSDTGLWTCRHCNFCLEVLHWSWVSSCLEYFNISLDENQTVFGIRKCYKLIYSICFVIFSEQFYNLESDLKILGKRFTCRWDFSWCDSGEFPFSVYFLNLFFQFGSAQNPQFSLIQLLYSRILSPLLLQGPCILPSVYNKLNFDLPSLEFTR